MNRRGFLGTLLGAAAAIVAPFTAARSPVFEFGSVELPWRWAVQLNASAILNDGWYATVHPDVEADIRTMVARSEWDAAWRHARKIGIAREATPQHILNVFREYQPAGGDNCSSGPFENVRFITSRVDAPDTLDGKQVSRARELLSIV